MISEWYDTAIILKFIDFLRQSANENGGLDVGDYWAICDEAADLIEAMLHYEQSHGIGEMNERIKEMAMEHFSVMPDYEELDSFARHLVRYCATICNTVSGDEVDNASGDYKEGREMGAIVCRNQIINTFRS